MFVATKSDLWANGHFPVAARTAIERAPLSDIVSPREQGPTKVDDEPRSTPEDSVPKVPKSFPDWASGTGQADSGKTHTAGSTHVLRAGFSRSVKCLGYYRISAPARLRRVNDLQIIEELDRYPRSSL